MFKIFDSTDDADNPIQEIGLFCDGCGCEFFDSDGWSRWKKETSDDVEEIKSSIRNDIDYNEYGWNYTGDGKDFCPRCAHYSDVLDRIVEHPLPQKIKDVIDVNTILRDGITEEQISTGNISLPVETVRIIKRMLYQYAIALTIANSEYNEAKAMNYDYQNDVADSKKFFNSWSAQSFLDETVGLLESIIGKYQDKEIQ